MLNLILLVLLSCFSLELLLHFRELLFRHFDPTLSHLGQKPLDDYVLLQHSQVLSALCVLGWSRRGPPAVCSMGIPSLRPPTELVQFVVRDQYLLLEALVLLHQSLSRLFELRELFDLGNQLLIQFLAICSQNLLVLMRILILNDLLEL